MEGVLHVIQRIYTESEEPTIGLEPLTPAHYE